MSTAETQAKTAVSETSSTTVVQTWLQKHERIIIVLLVLLFGTFVVQKYYNISAKLSDYKITQTQSVLNTQKQQDADELAQVKQTLQSYEQALQESQSQNKQLTNAIAQRNQQLAQSQQEDANLAPSQLATKWQSFIDDKGVQDTQNGFSLTESAGRATVEQLEEVPVLTQNLADANTKITGDQTDINNANNLITQGKATITSLQTTLVDQQKACTAQVNQVKAQARKSKLKWFGAGFVSGLITGLAKVL